MCNAFVRICIIICLYWDDYVVYFQKELLLQVYKSYIQPRLDYLVWL